MIEFRMIGTPEDLDEVITELKSTQGVKVRLTGRRKPSRDQGGMCLQYGLIGVKKPAPQAGPASGADGAS